MMNELDNIKDTNDILLDLIDNEIGRLSENLSSLGDLEKSAVKILKDSIDNNSATLDQVLKTIDVLNRSVNRSMNVMNSQNSPLQLMIDARQQTVNNMIISTDSQSGSTNIDLDLNSRKKLRKLLSALNDFNDLEGDNNERDENS